CRPSNYRPPPEITSTSRTQYPRFVPPCHKCENRRKPRQKRPEKTETESFYRHCRRIVTNRDWQFKLTNKHAWSMGGKRFDTLSGERLLSRTANRLSNEANLNFDAGMNTRLDDSPMLRTSSRQVLPTSKPS